MLKVVDLETATKAVNEWLEYKKISDKKREASKDSIDALIDAACEGLLILNDDKSFSQTLKWPLGKDGTIKDFKFKPRIRMGEVHKHLKGVKPDDVDGRMKAYIAALTNQAVNVIDMVDSEDYSTMQSIAVFFL